MWGAEYRYREELYEKNINKKAESRDLVFCFCLYINNYSILTLDLHTKIAA